MPQTVFLSVFAVVGVMMCVASLDDDTDKPPPKPKTQAELRTEKIERHFSAWDGTHRGLAKLVKASMNDPSSYEHDRTRYSDMGDHLIVTMSFRGKNAFGGTVKNSVKAKVGLNGEVIEILDQGP